MAHTPGPWTIGRKASYRGQSYRAIIQAEAPQWLADIAWIPNDEDEEESNARLIAAAPETAAERDHLREVNAELLEACQSLLVWYRRGIGWAYSAGDMGQDEFQAALSPLAKAESAIAKATG